eukprot:g50614.t1
MAEDLEDEGEPPFHHQVQLTVVVLSLLSAAACVLVLSLVACQCAKIQRSAYLQLSVNLVVAAGIQAISWAWGVSTEHCLAPGFLKLLSGVASLMFICCLSVAIYWIMFFPDIKFIQSEFQHAVSRRITALCWSKALAVLHAFAYLGAVLALYWSRALAVACFCLGVVLALCWSRALAVLLQAFAYLGAVLVGAVLVQGRWLCMVLCWSTALAVALTVLGLQAFGPEDYWCWIDEDDLILRVLLFDVIMALGLSVIVFVLVSLRIYGVRLDSTSAYRGDQNLAVIARDLSAKIMQKAMTFFLCLVWGLLDDILDYFAPEYAYYTEIPSAFITPLYGLIISLLFLLDFPSLIGRDTSTKATQVKTHSGSAASTPPYNCKATPESNLATGPDTSRQNTFSGGNDLHAVYIGNESDPGQAEVDSVHGEDAYDDFDSKIEIEFVMEAHQDEDLVLPDSEEMRKALQSSLRGSTSLERKTEPADLEEPDDHAPRNCDVDMESGVLKQGRPSPAAAVPRTSASTPRVSTAVPRTSTSSPPRVSAAVPRTSPSNPPRPRTSASTAPRVSASKALVFNVKQASTSVEHGPPLDKPQSLSSLAAALRGSSGRSKRFDVAENSHLPTLQSFDTSENSHLPT